VSIGESSGESGRAALAFTMLSAITVSNGGIEIVVLLARALLRAGISPIDCDPAIPAEFRYRVEWGKFFGEG
jgi:hypothetical protein